MAEWGGALPKKSRYSMPIRGMGSQSADLLECLLRIDREEPLDERSEGLMERLLAGGLLERRNGRLVLTSAGIERCRSLQLRASSDKEAVKILRGRAPESGDKTD